MDDLQGKTVKGFELRELLGAGGFGAVYRAWQPLIKREVAVKIVLPQYANHPDFIRRFEAEAQIVARLESARIVPLYDYWREPDSAYLVMRYFRGGSLSSAISADPWSTEATSRLLDQVAEGLTIAHRHHVIHRDVKPDNILLDEDGNAYLADFGIAMDLAGTGLESDQEDSIVGSPMYMSPEQIQSQPLSPQTDIYSLGMVLYQILTGQPPFPESKSGSLIMMQLSEPIPGLIELRPDLPPLLNSVLQKATAKNPADRYQDTASLAAAFRQATALGDGSENTARLAQPASLLADTEVQAPARAMPAPENPYKGLRAFQEFDAADFFGREQVVNSLLARFQATDSAQRFLAIVGPSGSGKSSAVRAGMIPAIRAGAIDGSAGWFLTEMVPGTHPLEELEAALMRVAVDPPDSLLYQLREDSRGLARAVKRILPGDVDSELLLYIDQFEEVFTLVDDEQERVHFLESLLAVAQDSHSRLRIIISMRADFFDRPLLYPDFGDLVRHSTEVVLPLNATELEQAITGPAERVGLELEPGLAAAIIADIAEQPGALPLLQHALSELYERRDGHRLTLNAYESSGRVVGALASRADELYNDLNDPEQLAARHMFLRLVTPGEGTEDTRRRVRQLELYSGSDSDEALQSIIDIFGKYRLLTFDHDPQTRESTVEVAHEALIRRWPRLRQWIDDSREDLLMHRRLTLATGDWLQAERDSSFLASGARLIQFESWSAITDLILNEQEQTYLDSSLEERKQRQAEEVERQEHELLLEQRSRSRLRALVAVLAVATVVALGLTALAFNQRNIAEENAAMATVAQGQAIVEANNAATAAADARISAQEARSLALVSSAELALRNNDTELAVILAMEAERNSPSPETGRTLAAAAYTPGSRRLFAGHQDWVESVAFGPDGKTLLSGARDNRVILWDLETGDVLQSFADHDDPVWDVAFSPDGSQIVSASQDRTIILRDRESGEIIHRLEGHEGLVSSVAFNPDGKTLLSGSFDDTLILWDVETGQIIRQFGAEGDGHTDDVYDIAFSASGFTALSGGADNTVILWNVQTGQPLFRLGADGSGHTDTIFSVAFTADESGALSTSNDQTLILWSFETGAPIRHFVGHSARVTDAAFSPDGKTILSTAEDNTVNIWDMATGSIIQRYAGQSGPMFTLDISDDGRHFLSGGWDTNIRLWDINNGAVLQHFDGHASPVNWVEYNHDGSQALSASEDSTIILWDTASGETLQRLEGHTGGVNSVAFSPDGTIALSGSNDLTMILWDLETGDILRQFGASNEGHTNAVLVVKFSPNGKTALSGSKDNSLILWNLETGAALQRFIGHRWWVSDVEFLPDGRRALSSSFDFIMILWDLETGEQVRSYEGHEDWVRSVALTQDGRFALSASADSRLILWDVESGRQLRQYEGHDTQVRSVDLSPDDTLAISGSNDTTLILWDVATGEILQRYSGHSEAVRNVAFSPDGQSVLSGSGDNIVRLWQIELDPGKLIAWAEQNRHIRDFSCAERQRFAIEPLCPAPTTVPDPSRQEA